MVTDNSMAEASFYKGKSSSPELDAMVLELRLLTIAGNFVLRLVHIAGTHMIDIGIDALSQGELPPSPSSFGTIHRTDLLAFLLAPGLFNRLP
jgi:hypothetical protein